MRQREFVTVRNLLVLNSGLESCMLYRYIRVEIDFARQEVNE